MCWGKKYIDRMKKQKMGIFVSWAASKFLFGLGIGLVLSRYTPLTRFNTELTGWFIIILAILVALPVINAVMK